MMLPSLNGRYITQSGYTLIELMIAITIIGILAAVGVASYQTQIRKAQFMSLYQEMNHFRLPYQILMDEGAGVTNFSPSGLNIPEQTKYCQFSVNSPAANGIALNAVTCTIQNISYVQGEIISLDRAADGSWQCRASIGIATVYLPKGCQ